MTLRVGVIGAGWVATARHIPVLQASDQAELVAVFDGSSGRAGAVASSGVLTTDDIEQFHDQQLDAVFVCTSPWSHADYATNALERGAHVLCEKPMALSVADAEAMVAAAKSHDRLICISHNFLWSNAMVRARRALVESGELRYVSGLQLSSDARRLPSWHKDLAGGLLVDEIPHMLYILGDLLGSELEVDDVRADWGRRDSEPQSCVVHLRGGSAPAQLSMVFGTPISEWHVSAVAERNVVDMDLFRDVAIVSGSDGAHRARDVLATSARVVGQHAWSFGAAGVRLARRRQFWGHDGLIEAFLQAVASGTDSPVSPDNALNVVRATCAIQDAISRLKTSRDRLRDRPRARTPTLGPTTNVS